MITICATNATANAINIKRLHQIESEAVFYTAKVTGSVLATQYPAEQFITLKKGHKYYLQEMILPNVLSMVVLE